MKSKFALPIGLLMTIALSVAYAQANPPNMTGEMPDHPHVAIGPGSSKPMVHPPIAVEMIGEMPDHPHVKVGPGSDRPMQPGPYDVRMVGQAIGYPYDRK